MTSGSIGCGVALLRVRRRSLGCGIAQIGCGIAQLLRKGGLSSNLGFKRSSPAAYCLKIWRESDWQHFLVMHILYITACNVHCYVTEEFEKKLLRDTCACIRRVKRRRDKAFLQCKMYSIAPSFTQVRTRWGEAIKQWNPHRGLLPTPPPPPHTLSIHPGEAGGGGGGKGGTVLFTVYKGRQKIVDMNIEQWA
jgi:hypothetical protein